MLSLQTTTYAISASKFFSYIVFLSSDPTHQSPLSLTSEVARDQSNHSHPSTTKETQDNTVSSDVFGKGNVSFDTELVAFLTSSPDKQPQ